MGRESPRSSDRRDRRDEGRHKSRDRDNRRHSGRSRSRERRRSRSRDRRDKRSRSREDRDSRKRSRWACWWCGECLERVPEGTAVSAAVRCRQ